MPEQPINQTFAYGKQGTIEYKPNWGQPITETGQWQGQPQPTTPTAPTIKPQQGGVDPYKIADRNLKNLGDYYENKVNTLKGYKLPPNFFNQALAKIQEEYDGTKFEMVSSRLQLDDIKQGIASGQIDPMAGQQAMMELVAPQGTVEAMFPKPERQQTEPRGRFTPSEFNSYVKEFGEVAKSTMVKPWLGKNYADPDKLKEQYFGVRAKYAYDTDMNTSEKKSFDLAWDQALSGSKHTIKVWKQLKETDPDVFMSRTYDTRLLDIVAAKAKGQPISPMAKALKPKVSLGTKIGLGVSSLSPLGGHMARRWMSKKREGLTNELPTPKTKAEYDSLPSGAQYIGTDGQMRAKK